MIAALAAAAAFSSAMLAFAPPLDHPLHYELTERRPRGDGTIRSATLTEEVAFVRGSDGYVMTIRTTGFRTSLPPGQSDAFDAVMKPMVDGVVRIHLSAGGVPERVIDGAASWSAMLAALRMQIAGRPAGAADVAPAATMLAALGATPPDARDARLIAAADDLLGTRLPPLAIGAESRADHGTVTRAADRGEEARFHEVARHPAAGRSLETDATVAVSRSTGLVTHSLRRTVIAGMPAPLLSESEVALVGRVSGYRR